MHIPDERVFHAVGRQNWIRVGGRNRTAELEVCLYVFVTAVTNDRCHQAKGRSSSAPMSFLCSGPFAAPRIARPVMWRSKSDVALSMRIEN